MGEENDVFSWEFQLISQDHVTPIRDLKSLRGYDVLSVSPSTTLGNIFSECGNTRCLTLFEKGNPNPLILKLRPGETLVKQMYAGKPPSPRGKNYLLKGNIQEKL